MTTEALAEADRDDALEKAATSWERLAEAEIVNLERQAKTDPKTFRYSGVGPPRDGIDGAGALRARALIRMFDGFWHRLQNINVPR